ncbi:MAG TPA: hypothetical protein VHF92_13800, partial [Geodermatophilus sp.]|nr:hypothetical protein [Geodermatophilus sp.]
MVAAATVAAAVLSGCSERQEANDTLPTATSEPTSTTEELPPLGPANFPMPAEARAKTPEGAVEFMRYYMSLTEVLAEQALDPQPLLDLSNGCGVCNRIAQSLAGDLAAGYRYQDTWIAFQPYGPGVLTGEQAEVGFVYAQGPITVL